MSQPLRRIRFKCRYDGEIRTVTVTPETEIGELKRRLSTDYGFDVSLKYEDRDGDTIILASQNDLDDIFLYGETDTVNVFVSETLSLPNLQMKGSSSSSRLGATLPATMGQGGTVASLYATSNVNSSLLSTNFNSTTGTTSTRDWPKPTQSDFSASTSTNASTSTLRSQAVLRPVNGTRLDRFPNISENPSLNRQQENVNIRWKRGEMLGQGAFGVVYLGLNIDSGELMAVKQMATDDVSKRELNSLENEIHLLRNLRHPNIVRYIGTELNSERLSIFLEYVPGGSLKALIDKFGHLEESVARSYTRQLLIGLEYLHRHGIAHRDIKGANCLVGNDGVIKLADFGNSKHWRPPTQTGSLGAAGVGGGGAKGQSSSGDIKGTPSWMAPEVIRDEGGSISWRKADIWSLGCTTVEMTTGKAPWAQFNNPVTILYHIACQDTLPEYPASASFELITFLNTCLQRDAKLRPDVTSLLLHPFVAHIAAPAASSGNWAAGGTAPGAQFQNRPSTVSHSVVGEWDRTSQQPSLFYSQQSATVGTTAQQQAALGAMSAEEAEADTPVRYSAPPQAVHEPQVYNVDHEAQPLRSPRAQRYAASSSAGAGARVEAAASAPGGDDPEVALEVDYSRNHPGAAADGAAVDNAVSRQANYPLRLAAIQHGTASPASTRSPKSHKQSPGLTGSGTGSGAKVRRTRKKGAHSVSEAPTRDTDSPFSLGTGTALGAMESQVAQAPQGVSGEKAPRPSNSVGQNEDEIITPPTTLRIPKLEFPANQQPLPGSTSEGLFQKNFSASDDVAGEDGVDPYLHMKGQVDNVGSNYPSSRSTRSGTVSSSQGQGQGQAPTGRFKQHKAGAAGGAGKGQKKAHRRSGAGGHKLVDFESFDSEDGNSWYADVKQQALAQQLQQREESLSDRVDGGVAGVRDGDEDTLISAELFTGYSSTEGGMDDAQSTRGTGGGGSSRAERTSSSVRSRGDSNATVSHTSSPAGQLQGRPLPGAFAAIGEDADGSYLEADAKKASDMAYSELNSAKGVLKPNFSKPQVITGPVSWKRLNNSRSQTELPEHVQLQDKSGNNNKATNVIKPSNLQAPNTGGWRRHGATVEQQSYGMAADVADVRGMRDRSGSYTALTDSLDAYGSADEIADDAHLIIHDDDSVTAALQTAQAQRQQTAQPARSSVHKSATAKQRLRDREAERDRDTSVNYDSVDGSDLANMSISGMNIDTMRISTALGVQPSLSTPAATAAPGVRTAQTAMRGSHSRKALETANASATGSTASGLSRHGSRQPLRTANRMLREKEREVEREAADPLDMSCDSLDKLQVTGTAATNSTRAEQREGTAKLTAGSTRQFKRTASGSRRHDEPNYAALSTQGNPNLSASVDDGDVGDGHTTSLGYFAASPVSLDEHTGAVTRLRAPERTNLLLSASVDGTIRIWGPEAGPSSGAGSRAVLEATGFKTDNTYSAFADQRPERRISLGTSGNPAAGDDSSVTGGGNTARGATVKITNMWVDEGCETIWGTCSDAAIRVWAGGEGRPLRLLKGHEDQITAMEGMDSGSSSASHLLQSSVSGNPSSCLVATGSADRTVRVWDVRAKKAQVFTFRGHGDTVLVLRWGEGGRSLISAGKDKSLRIWDTRAGRPRVTLEKHFGSVSCVRVLSNGPQGGAGNYNSALSSTGGGSSKGEADSAAIVSAGRDSMINVWSASGDCMSSQAAHRGNVSFLSDINYPGGGGYSHAYAAQQGMNSRAWYSAPFATGPMMLSLGADGAIKVWDMRRFKCTSEIAQSAQGGCSTKAVWCAQGFVTGSNTGAVRLYEHTASIDPLGSLSTARDIGTAGYPNGDYGGLEGIGRSGSGSPGAMPYGAPLPGVTASQDWLVRDLAVHSGGGGGGAASQAQQAGGTGSGAACTDLLCTESLCASASKSGQILRWSR